MCDQNNSSQLCTLAFLEGKLENYQEADLIYEKIFELYADKVTPIVITNYAFVKLKLHQYEKAHALYEKGLPLYEKEIPENVLKAAAEAKAKVEALK